MKFICAIACLAVFWSSAGFSKAALIDDFNANVPGLGYTSLLPGGLWTVTNTVDVIDSVTATLNGFNAGVVTPGHGNVIHLAGSGTGDNRGKLTSVTSYPSVGPLHYYEISVDVAFSAFSGGVTEEIRVGLGSSFQDFTVSSDFGFFTANVTPAFGAFGNLFISFVTPGTGTSRVGPLIDNVKIFVKAFDPVPDPVPEPASLLAFGLLVGGVIVSRRKFAARKWYE